jgi:hypothetical protein
MVGNVWLQTGHMDEEMDQHECRNSWTDQQERRNSWTNNDNSNAALRGNNDATDDLPVLSLTLETALEAQIVPERDLNNKVQQRMDDITIDTLTVEVVRPRGAVPKSVIMTNFGVSLIALLAIGSAVGIKNRKARLTNTFHNENESV